MDARISRLTAARHARQAMDPLLVADAVLDITDDKRFNVGTDAGRHIPQTRIQIAVIVNSEHQPIASTPVLVLILRKWVSALLIEDTERWSVFERSQIVGKLAELFVQGPCMIDGPAFLVHAVQEDVLVSIVDHVFCSFVDVSHVCRSDCHLTAHVPMPDINEVIDRGNCPVVCTAPALVEPARIMQLLVAINRDGKRRVHLILIKKLLHFRFKVQESV